MMFSAGDDAVATIPLVERGLDEILFRRENAGLTAARFLRDTRRLAADLPEASHLLNLCQDRYNFTVTFAAAVLRGQVNLLTSNRSPDALRDLAGRFDITTLAHDDTAFGPAPRGHRVVLPDDAVTDAPENADIPVSRLAAIVFTSGSTGAPVGHRKSWGALATRSRDAALRFGMTGAAPPAIVGTVPPQHMYGFETTVLLPLHAAASSWCGPAFYPGDIRRALETVPAPRILVTTPLQLRALLGAEVDLPPLAAIISATAPMDPALAAGAERRWDVPVLEIFGATEVGSIASRRTTDGDMWETYARVGLSRPVGLPEESVVVTAPHAEARALADVIELRDKTHFRLLGRPGDLIKLGGRRASLAGLNSILNQIDGVHDGVFVAPEDLDRRPSARLLAYVIAPDRSAEDILTALRDRVDPVFLPRRVIRVDALPRNEVGKLPRDALLSLVDTGGGTAGDS
jgi:acyl-coenzyme A synthetase/AMP-(fatty) acid ligase